MLAKLEKFKAAISAKSTGSNTDVRGDKNEDLSDWIDVSLKFAPDSGKVCFIFLFTLQHQSLVSFFDGAL